MNEEKHNICKEFERDVFLLIEDDLSNERRELIKHHLSECTSCRSFLEDVNDLIVAYNALSLKDIDDSLFHEMMDKAIKGNSILDNNQQSNYQKRKSLIETFGFYRLTFGGAAVVTAIILIIISFIKEPYIRKRLPLDILDWQGDKITNSIEQIEGKILSLKSDEWDIYIVRKNKKENWDATLRSIRDKINKIKKSTNNKEL